MFIKGHDRKSEKREREREWEQRTCLQEFGVITPTHVSTSLVQKR